ncbi:MAG: ATP-binding cassette domain-containing protein [Polymorphobacter sp.]|uniref:ATP-binding cassette domain-containing protein n=1 Tax=Polymorphobacter sp. TaxID=1909290 RepID=UPI003A8351C1
MSAQLTIGAGAARDLPAGGWRVVSGAGELYLLSAARRRLVAPLEAGAGIAPVAAPLGLLVVATDEMVLAPEDGLARDWAALAAAHEAEDEARGAALLARLEGQEEEGADGLAAALAALGGAGKAVGGDVLAAAKAAGLRAARVSLGPGWWRDDHGPLVVKGPTGFSAALWQGGGYVDGAGATPDWAAFERAAWRVYGRLGGDVSRFSVMAKALWPVMRTELPLVVGAALGAAVLGLLVPLATGWLFDEIVPAGYGGLLVGVGLALVVAALVNGAFAVVRGLAVARLSGRAEVAAAGVVSDHVLRLPARFFRTMSAGDFNQRLLALDQIRGLVLQVLLNSGMTAVFSVFYLALLFVYAPALAWVALAVSVVAVGALLVARVAQAGPLREAAVTSGRLAGLTYEILDGVAKLRVAAAEGRALARWRAAYVAERDAQARGERVAINYQAFADGWQVLGLLAIFAAAAILVGEDLSAGQFIAFLAAFGVFQGNLAGLASALIGIFAARPLAERVRPILVAEVESDAGRVDPGVLSGDISVSGLTFGYDGAMAPLIDGLSFSVKPGEHLAIVGGSGSGKSTILRLLLGFETPLTGSIAYDGQELSGLDPGRVRAQIGVVMQSSQLFAGSILDNIRGASDAGLQACMDAAEAAGLGADLAMMPMGLHTMLTEGAGMVSGGQRQRILIARALAGRPRILFFDEATSALDNATQAVVAETLDRLAATRITIAHRLSTVRHATRIAVLERGRFVEVGSFSELMAKDGAFAALAKRQLLEA